MSADQVAECRRVLAEAEADHAAAVAAVVAIDSRVALRGTMQKEITQRRVADAAAPGDAAEFCALSADIEVLTEARSEAQACADALDPAPARAALQVAEEAHRWEQNEAAFRAISERLIKLDSALVDALRLAYGLGGKIGRRSLSECFRPSPDLDRALRYGWVKP